MERIDGRAHRLVGGSLFALAAYVAYDAIKALILRERPVASPIGIGVTALSMGVMWWLAREKRRAAKALGSRALEADSFQTTACWWLSIIVLGGIGLNGLLGWWWADPLAGLVIVYYGIKEGWHALHGA